MKMKARFCRLKWKGKRKREEKKEQATKKISVTLTEKKTVIYVHVIFHLIQKENERRSKRRIQLLMKIKINIISSRWVKVNEQ